MFNFHKSVFGIAISVVLSSYLLATPAVCDKNGNGSYEVTSDASSGDHTLRACITNTEQYGGTVVFATDMTIMLSAVIFIDGNSNKVTIDGSNHSVILDGSNSTGIFSDENAENITLKNLTLQNSTNTALTIDNLGSVTIEDCVFTQNQGYNGGAIYTYRADVNISNSIISHNNSSLSGGGISINNTSNLIISNSTISYNHSNYFGGGIYADDHSNLTISNSTISHNNSAYAGGGIASFYSSTANITNSTISHNTSEDGGGIVVHRYSNLDINASTISENNATLGSGGVYNAYASHVNIRNTILYGNNAQGSNVNDDANKVTSLGYNLVGVVESFIDYDSNTDILNQDPLLGPLQNNGGDTLTYALLKGSPAIDAGYSEIPVDQRYVQRDNSQDIGSYEYKESGWINPAIIMYLLD